MTLKKKSLILICILIIALLAVSCGKKGTPTLKAYEKPASPININVLHRGEDIYISWQYPAHERQRVKGCQMLKSGDGGINFNELVFLKPDELYYTDKDFSTGHEYYYKIRCLSVRDIYSDDSAIIKISPLPPPYKPKDISYIVTNDSIKIQWGFDASAHYNIYKSFQSGGYSLYPINSQPLRDSVFIDKLETEKTVYYTVRSSLGTLIRDESPPSDELEVNPASFKPASPTGLVYVPLENKIYLLWKDNDEVWIKGYRVYRKRLLEDKFILIGESAAPVFTVIESFVSKTAFYVTAIGPVAESSPSEIIEVVPH